MKLDTAIVDTFDPETGTPARWQYPVAAGAPKELVQKEIKARVQAAGLDHDSLTFQYPAGPFQGPVTSPDEVVGFQWAAEQEAAARAARQGPATSPDEPNAFAKPPRPAHPLGQGGPEYGGPTGPLPPPPAPYARPQSRDGYLSQGLDAALGQWAAAGKVSSAEFYFHLAAALARHGKTLVSAEQARRTHG